MIHHVLSVPRQKRLFSYSYFFCCCFEMDLANYQRRPLNSQSFCVNLPSVGISRRAQLPAHPHTYLSSVQFGLHLLSLSSTPSTVRAAVEHVRDTNDTLAICNASNRVSRLFHLEHLPAQSQALRKYLSMLPDGTHKSSRGWCDCLHPTGGQRRCGT